MLGDCVGGAGGWPELDDEPPLPAVLLKHWGQRPSPPILNQRVCGQWVLPLKAGSHKVLVEVVGPRSPRKAGTVDGCPGDT